MSAPNIQDLIELTIFHAIRMECVGRGYLPDITTYANTPSGYTAYQAQLATIVSDKGFCIEVFNNSNPQYKGVKKPPRIVIISENFVSGTTGVEGTEQFEDLGPNFRGYTLPNLLVDFTFRVHLVAETNQQIRELTSILSKAIPFRGFKSIYLVEYPEEGEQTFFINNIGYADTGLAQDDLIERTYRYEVDDLMNAELITYTTTYSKLIQLTLDTSVNEYAGTSLELFDAPHVSAGPDLDLSLRIDAVPSVEITGWATSVGDITWVTSGTGTFTGDTTPTPRYSPSIEDIGAGTVTLTISAEGLGDHAGVSDTMVLTITVLPPLPPPEEPPA